MIECTECGEPLPEARALQEYRVCVECAEAYERVPKIQKHSHNTSLKPRKVDYEREWTKQRREILSYLDEQAEKEGL